MHALRGFRRCGVDAANARMRVGATHESRVQRAGQAHVVNEAAVPGEQRRVFLALDRGPKPFRSHSFLRYARLVSLIVRSVAARRDLHHNSRSALNWAT